MSMLQGALMPIFGGVMAKMLFVLMDVFDLKKSDTKRTIGAG